MQLDSTVHEIAQQVADALDALCVFGILTDGVFSAVAFAEVDGRPVADVIRRIATLDPIPADPDHPLQRALATGEPIVIEPTVETTRRRFARVEDQEAMIAFAVKNNMFVPVLVRGRVIGAFSAVRHGVDGVPFDAREIRFARHLAMHAGLALDNAKLVVSAQQHADRLNMLSQLTHEFALATGDYEKLVGLVAIRVGSVMGEYCSIRLIDSAGFYELEGAIYHQDPAKQAAATEILRSVRQHVDEGVAGEALRTGKAVMVSRVDPARASFSPHHRDLIAVLPIASMIAVPLRSAGKIIGMAIVSRSDAFPPFDEDDRKLVEDLAAHASVAITNARLLDEHRRMADRQSVLSEASKELAAALGDPRGLVDRVTRLLAETIGDLCVLRLVSSDGRTLERDGSAFHNSDPRVADTVRAALGGIQLVGEGFEGTIVASGRPTMIAATSPQELAAMTEPRYRAMMEGLGLTCMLGVPMIVHGRVIGVITLTRSRACPFTDEDLAFAQELAQHATLSVNNARLLTAVRTTEEQLRQAQKMEAIGRLAGGVAHDFNNLLSVVLSYCSFIAEDLPVGDPIIESVDQIRIAGERAADLTRQLLAFSRHQMIEPVVLDAGESIEKLEQILRRLVGEDVEVHIVRAPDLGLVKADPGRIDQVILNLVVNARDAMPDGGTLTIETANVDLDDMYAKEHFGVEPGPHVMIAITDTGCGMDKATQDRIFEPFFTTKQPGKGTGLGLSTVFGIVQQTGGSIWVDSQIGRGTTFKIYLRRSDEGDLRRSGPHRGRKTGAETILLVEDDPQVRQVARGILERKGYRLHEANSGTEALEFVRAHPDERIDLLLTDVVMPKMSGRELADLLAPIRPTLKVLFMSGYTDDAILHHRVFAPGVALLQKPLTPDTLLRHVRAILDTAS